MHDHYIQMGEYGAIFILIAFFVAISFNRFANKSEKTSVLKDKKIEISPFQKDVLASIRSSLPSILTDIAYNYPEFSNIANKN